MTEHIKQRMVGIAVLLLLVVVLVPWLLGHIAVDSEQKVADQTAIEDAQLVQVPTMTRGTSAHTSTSRVAPAKITPKKRLVFHQQTKAEVPNVHPQAKPQIQPIITQGWYAQIAGFSSKINAEKLVSRLKKSQIPCKLERYASVGKRIYRVYLGPFSGKSQAYEQARPWMQGQHMPLVSYTKG